MMDIEYLAAYAGVFLILIAALALVGLAWLALFLDRSGAQPPADRPPSLIDPKYRRWEDKL
jgi:hypothetical protein